MSDTYLPGPLLVPTLLLMALYVVRRKRREAADVRTLEAARAAGLTEPPSLHPVVDPNRCIGSAGCTRACPEGALGIVAGKATLTNPSLCIGHGACEASCPVGAITLVFGTERRGIDIPRVSPQFETNVGGVFIVGELGGMGLIRKASEQGRQAIATIARRVRGTAPLDVVIVGAGPAGIAAGLAALEAKLRFLLIEQEPDLGGSVLHYPRAKIAMTQPVDLPIVGTMRFTEVSKEALLEFWKRVVGRTRLDIRYGERMERLESTPAGHVVVTPGARYETTAVVLAIGRRGTPRRLEVPGEELPEGRLPAARRRAVPRPAGAGRRWGRQRDRGCARVRRGARNDRHARVSGRRVQSRQAAEPAAHRRRSARRTRRRPLSNPGQANRV